MIKSDCGTITYLKPQTELLEILIGLYKYCVEKEQSVHADKVLGLIICYQPRMHYTPGGGGG